MKLNFSAVLGLTPLRHPEGGQDWAMANTSLSCWASEQRQYMLKVTTRPRFLMLQLLLACRSPPAAIQKQDFKQTSLTKQAKQPLQQWGLEHQQLQFSKRTKIDQKTSL